MYEQEVREIAEEYLENVKPSGSENIMASCPFHDTDTPERGLSRTFSMSLVKGLFHCFSCGESGNLRTFLRKLGVRGKELHNKYGFIINKLRENHPLANKKKKKATQIPLIEERVLGVFDYLPEELLEAGFWPETLNHFDVGYDQHWDRITYPVRDLTGGLVAIYGRRKDSNNKYLPYGRELEQWGVFGAAPPPVGQLLWHADIVAPEVMLSKRWEPVILTEGYKGCMWVWQCGYRRVVHSFGSDLTKEQAKIITKLGTEVIIMYDGDQAGDWGALKAGYELRKSMKVRVADLMHGHQPDDLDIEDVEEVLDCSEIFEKWKRTKETDEWRRAKRLKKLTRPPKPWHPSGNAEDT